MHPDPDTRHAPPVYDPAACRALMRGGSRTFFAASLLLPARVRAPACALYAYCRLADDAVDDGANPLQALAQLNERLDALYAGRPRAIEADLALAGVVHRFAIPRTLLDALLEGFVWDLEGRRYETLDDLQAYAARVAGTVGAMMALVMDTRDAHAVARACDLGVAMQLTNIARDVGEDARRGRIYLPLAWLREAGIDPDAWLAQPRHDAALATVVQRLLQAAEALYARAEHGIAALPRDCRAAILAARLAYAEIGHQLAREGLDAVSRRTVVPGRRKLALVAQASSAAVRAPAHDAASLPPLPATRYLVDAVAAGPHPAFIPARNFPQRVGWVLQLFERQLAQRQALQRPLARPALAQRQLVPPHGPY
ncbi:phytoene/squalene synthase family protein [Rubrivivax albus]|nr:phytoene/squalene synthase family protein [Rubrivivax albus]